MDCKIIFLGSPEYSVPILKKLNKNYLVSGVVTQPDKPAGRGKKQMMTPVKEFCLENKLRIMQPFSLKSEETQYILKRWGSDVFIVAAFGLILPQSILDLPRKGSINVHPSLLPRWRGAAPIQAAIMSGDQETGVTIMKMDAGIDTGPILSQEKYSVGEEETYESLSKNLSLLGADLLIKTLPKYLEGSIEAKNQDDKNASYVKLLHKKDGLIQFDKSTDYILRMVRALNPWPGTYFYWNGKLVKVFKVCKSMSKKISPGQLIEIDKYPAFGVADGIMIIKELQLEGKKRMKGDEFLRGVKNWNSGNDETN